MNPYAHPAGLLNTHAGLTIAIDKLRAAGDHAHAELFEAARADRIVVMFAWRSSTVPMRLLKQQTKPTLVVIGDDDYQSTGPAGWQNAAALMRWCSRTVLHGSGADVATYRGIADVTAQVGRMLLVETSFEHLPAWVELAKDKPALVIVPQEGRHPIEGTMH